MMRASGFRLGLRLAAALVALAVFAVADDTQIAFAQTFGTGIEPSALTVPVGSRACYRVTTATKPSAALTITATSDDTDKATVAPADTSDWHIPNSDVNWKAGYAFCVTGVAAGSTTITNAIASDDTNYDGVTTAAVSVTVTAADTKPTVRFLHTYINAVEGSTASLNIGRGQAGPGSVHAYNVRKVTVKLDIAPAPTSSGQIAWDLLHAKRVCHIYGCDQSHSDSAGFNIDYAAMGLIGRQVRYTSGSNDMEFEFHIRMDNDVEEDETVRIYLLNRQFAPGSFIRTNHAVCVGECDSDASDVDWTAMTFRIIDDDTAVQERGVQERSSSPPPGQSPQVTYAALITKIKEWRDDPCCASNPDHTKRWDRTLLAFGETVPDPSSLTKMTATEAQGYADRGWSRWVAVAEALGELENRL